MPYAATHASRRSAVLWALVVAVLAALVCLTGTKAAHAAGATEPRAAERVATVQVAADTESRPGCGQSDPVDAEKSVPTVRADHAAPQDTLSLGTEQEAALRAPAAAQPPARAGPPPRITPITLSVLRV